MLPHLRALAAALLLSSCSFGVLHAQTGRTEEYAIISIYQYGKRNYMSVTVGSVSTEEKEFEKQKSEKKFDLAPVIAEMEKLNAMGYELMDHSSAILPASGDYGGGSPFYSFVFRKRIAK